MVVFSYGANEKSYPNKILADDFTTPLSVLDESTHTGTYEILSIDHYYTADYSFSSSDLNYFSGQMVIDVEADWSAKSIRWKDNDLGNFADYQEQRLSKFPKF